MSRACPEGSRPPEMVVSQACPDGSRPPEMVVSQACPDGSRPPEMVVSQACPDGSRPPEMVVSQACPDGSRPSEMVVSQACPDGSRPRMVRGTISTEPSEAGSKVKLPNATGPVPGRRTRSSVTTPSNRVRSHFSPAVKRSSPAGSVIRATSPQPTSPHPCRTQASAEAGGDAGRDAGGDAGGIRASRSPGSAMGTVRAVRPPGSVAGRPGPGFGSPGVASFPSVVTAVDFTAVRATERLCHPPTRCALPLPAASRHPRETRAAVWSPVTGG